MSRPGQQPSDEKRKVARTCRPATSRLLLRRHSTATTPSLIDSVATGSLLAPVLARSTVLHVGFVQATVILISMVPPLYYFIDGEQSTVSPNCRSSKRTGLYAACLQATTFRWQHSGPPGSHSRAVRGPAKSALVLATKL